VAPRWRDGRAGHQGCRWTTRARCLFGGAQEEPAFQRGIQALAGHRRARASTPGGSDDRAGPAAPSTPSARTRTVQTGRTPRGRLSNAFAQQPWYQVATDGASPLTTGSQPRRPLLRSRTREQTKITPSRRAPGRLCVPCPWRASDSLRHLLPADRGVLRNCGGPQTVRRHRSLLQPAPSRCSRSSSLRWAPGDGSQLTASSSALVWAVRLASYLFRRILRTKVDHRFDEMRDKPLRFARSGSCRGNHGPVVMRRSPSFRAVTSARAGRGRSPAWRSVRTGLLIEAVPTRRVELQGEGTTTRRLTRAASGGTPPPQLLREMIVWWPVRPRAPFLDGARSPWSGRCFITLLLPLRERLSRWLGAKAPSQVRATTTPTANTTSDEHPRPLPPRS
jgi:hypothetical protein